MWCAIEYDGVSLKDVERRGVSWGVWYLGCESEEVSVRDGVWREVGDWSLRGKWCVCHFRLRVGGERGWMRNAVRTNFW